MISRSRSSMRAATSGSDSGEKKRASSMFRSGTGGTESGVPLWLQDPSLRSG